MNHAVTKAGFFPRLGAYLIDSLLVGMVLLCLKIPVGILEFVIPDALIFENVLFHFNIFDIIFYLLALLYFVLTTSITGTTIGKRLFNLTVVDAEGKNLTFWNALYRESIGKYLSGVFYFGYIMIFIDKNNRAFHDYLCDSSVIYTCKLKVVEKKVIEYATAPQSMNSAPINNNLYTGGITNPGEGNVYMGNAENQSANIYSESLPIQKG